MSINSEYDIDIVIELLFSDVIVLLDIFLELIHAYEYASTAAYNISRISEQPSLDAAIIRMDKTGTLADMVLYALSHKLSFALSLTSISPAPLGLITGLSFEDKDFFAAKQILYLEIIRRLLQYCDA